MAHAEPLTTEPPAASTAPQLHRVLGTASLALLSVSAIVGARWLAVAAPVGPSSLVLWVLGLLCYMVPMALAVLELSARVPGEGGLYLWSKAAFGETAGFVAGWAFWVSNLVYFPTLLLFAAGGFVFIGGTDWL